jgi:hypothetical protein
VVQPVKYLPSVQSRQSNNYTESVSLEIKREREGEKKDDIGETIVSYCTRVLDV